MSNFWITALKHYNADHPETRWIVPVKGTKIRAEVDKMKEDLKPENKRKKVLEGLRKVEAETAERNKKRAEEGERISKRNEALKMAHKTIPELDKEYGKIINKRYDLAKKLQKDYKNEKLMNQLTESSYFIDNLEADYYTAFGKIKSHDEEGNRLSLSKEQEKQNNIAVTKTLEHLEKLRKKYESKEVNINEIFEAVKFANADDYQKKVNNFLFSK